MSTAAAFQTRFPAGPRTRFRPRCRPATAAFRDWLRPDRTAKGVPGLDRDPIPEETDKQPDTTDRGTTRMECNVPEAFLPILSEQQQEQQQPPQPVTGSSRRNSRHNGDDEPPAKPRFWEAKMSEIEWVFLNELYPKFPEAWHYVYERAMLRKGLEPTIPPFQPKPEP